MEGDLFYEASYNESKSFSQQEVRSDHASGFTAAADNYMERGIDLNEQLVRNKPATFFMRVKGNTMTGAGIHDGDVVIVDRSVKPVSGRVIIAALNGEMLIRRLEKTFNRIRLLPETPKLSAIDIDPFNAEFSIWGVVTYVIHAP
ncbi:MAG: peptidase S24 [Bacteroidetes bacterium]|nr:MAG: peptidase S24 [Bacteroidota bacterium]